MALTRAKVKALRGLAQKKSRNERGEFLIEGLRLLQEAANSDVAIVEAYHTDAFAADAAGKSLLQKLSAKHVPLVKLGPRELDAIADTQHAQGVVAVARQRAFTVDRLLQGNKGPSVIVAFDAVSDPGNLGSMIRTCDWFGVHGILLGRNSVELYNPKVIRATMGGIFHLPVVEDVDLLSAVTKAKSIGYRVSVTDAAGETHFDRVQLTSRAMILFGNEAWGVSDQLKQLADERISIRRYGSGESLNVGVACGIVLSALHKLYD